MYPPVIQRTSLDLVRKYLEEAQWPAPVIAGGIGGSGTRLVAQMLQSLGFSMGQHLNGAGDALPFTPVYDNHIPTYLTGTVVHADFIDELLAAVVVHRGVVDAKCPWGWKNPRSLYLLPLLDELFEGMRFIHVVRDGHVMSTSRNQAQLAKYGPIVIPQKFQHLPEAERALLLWSYVNTAVADYGNCMGKRYICLRYEDICDSPGKATADLALALGIKRSSTSCVVVNTPRTRTLQEHSQQAQTTAGITAVALQRFGYTC
jgi:Sulfotransferase family